MQNSASIDVTNPGIAGDRRGWIERGEHAFEELIFRARWVLAPAYLILALSLLVLAYKTAEEFVQLVLGLRVFDEARAILQVLTIVDLVLVLNLVVMIILVGYVNFVSKIEPTKHVDWPKWMGHLDYSGLKVQLLGSIIAIASIKLLHTFIEVSESSEFNRDRLMWMVVLYLSFLVAVLFIAVVNRLKATVNPPEL